MIFAFFCLISAKFVIIMSVFSQLKLFYFKLSQSAFSGVLLVVKCGMLAEDESCRFGPPKSVQDKVSLLVQN